jgi:hypothetical protein
MNNNNLLVKKNIIIALAVTLVVASVFLIVRQLGSQKPSTVLISNLGSCTKKIHPDVKEAISKETYLLVKSANDYNKKQSLSKYKANIRDGSCNQGAEEKNTGYSGKSQLVKSTSITLDIPDAKQSWKISFDWINKGTKIDTDLGTISPECLSKDALVYGDFNCEKIMSLALYGTDKYDPILQYMPYSGQGFNLEYNPDTRAVKAQILVPQKDVNNKVRIDNDKYAVTYWFKHRNLDPSTYTITYEVVPL